MKQKINILLILLTVGSNLLAQTPQNSDPSAALEVDSTTKGFLPPRMTTVQRNAIANPAQGLTIFNTSTDKLNFYDGTQWVASPVDPAGVGSSIADADGDTQIQVEESANEDIIRFDVAGTEVASMTAEGFVNEPWKNFTLQNGWTDLINAPSLAYYKDVSGVVHVRGFIQGGTTTSQSLIATLPVGYRPSVNYNFVVNSNDSFGAINVLPTENIVVRVLSTSWNALNFSFPTN